jgi:hypothetical protein
MRIMKKSVIAILATTIIILSFIGPLFLVQAAIDPADWYMTVEGVLDTDYYELYPFEDESFTVGFSKFGEFIDQSTGMGLNYSGKDPFANEGISAKYWVNGWYCDARYIHRFHGVRHFWAFALFADGVATAGNWINNATDQYGSPHGGRKTSGIAVTEDITVLYDSPRRFVGMVVTHLNDTYGDDSWHLMDVIFTIIFNKVKKEVIVLKDIKLKIDAKILEGPVDIQFSNRGEWDLGPAPDWESYAHFYHQELSTCFNASWHMSQNITREYYYHNTTYSGTILQLPYSSPYGLPVVSLSEFIYVNGVWYMRGEDYEINYDTGVISFYQELYLDEVEVYYKLYKLDGENGPMAMPHEYDLAQIISADLEEVGFAAFWPILSDYSVYGWDHTLEPLYNVSQADAPPGEPQIPFVIGEWDFMLDYGIDTPNWDQQFRGVTVYGIVNYHDADDAQGSDLNSDTVIENQIDIEVQYQLNEVFNPWDLNSAVHKDTKRWVDFYTVTETDVSDAQLGFDLYIDLEHAPVLKASVWEAYCVFSERVLWEDELKYPIRSVYTGYDYELYLYSNDEGYIWIDDDDVPAAGTRIKILYSTYTSYDNFGSINPVVVDEYVYINPLTIMETYQSTIIDPLGANHTLVVPQFGFTITALTALTQDATFSLYGTMDFYEEDFKVFKEGKTVINAIWWDQTGPHGGRVFRHVDDDGTLQINFTNFRMQWHIMPPAGEDLHVDWLHLDVDYNITAFYNNTTGNYTVTIDFEVNGEGGNNLLGVSPGWGDRLYAEHVPGRWEWIEVGRDAASIDSAGAALVSAAFKNKQVEIGIAGADMNSTTYANWMPYIMTKFGTGNAVTDYHYNYPGGDHRTALKDDYCTTWPVASSNLIGVGGPIANVFAWYGNDFTEAFFGIDSFTDYAMWENKIAALTCWNKKSYESTLATGYAVIGTYKDINGSVLLLIWGHWGRDTYFATKWFHEEGIYQLQEAPECLSSIIIEIDYTVHEPEISIVECLGTISETLWMHGIEAKGGIHDP